MCTFLLQNGALWDICVMHCGICEKGLLIQHHVLLFVLLFLYLQSLKKFFKNNNNEMNILVDQQNIFQDKCRNCYYFSGQWLLIEVHQLFTHWGLNKHEDIIKWKHFPCYWPFVWGIHRSPVNSPHKGQWRGALMFSLICVWINGWVNNRKAGDLRRHHAHYDVIIMKGW